MGDVLKLDTLDLLVILGSLAAVLVAGIRGARGTKNGAQADFVLAGRSLTLPFFVASLVATWYGAVLGSGEFIMRYGITFILCFGLPYYIVAVFYSLWLAQRIRDSKAVSIPDQLGMAYGPKARTVAGIVMLIITIPASYQLMLGVIVQSITGWSLLLSIIVGSIVSLIYVAKGGLRSDIYANVVQFIIMYAGFIALVVGCMSVYGSPVELYHSLPEPHLSIPGVLGWTPVVGWFLVALQTFIDPNFHVRAAAAKDISTAKRGIVVSVGLWMVFDALQLLAGLYAVSHIHGVAPTDTYVALAQAVLPSMWKGLFVAGVIAAVMSTLDGYALVSATTIGHDLIDPWRGTAPRVSSLRIGLVITSVVGLIAAWFIPSIIDLIYNAASIVVPALLLPLFMSFSRRAERFAHVIVPIIVIPALVSVAAFALDLGEPMLLGLGASILLIAFRSIHRAPTTI
ncbi:MAG: sodium:solute symporter family protein [Candidatus Kapabacteria bacterium]|nr:sodium:solute symporter family protein [Ignavibacteria bacterium]MBP6510076.1 sodium:solute symporter family protein [Candidatus Kapabacteria bacterium]MBK6418279.1 sodium:solute symporter family protein [Ignavibacteria bacterium]MBK6761176.1 sodium:solute symporter family protein [Ignavibacteria bacterium]MBK7032202.1 sodium:solute symporter family protein [Ignavibacteria bacterium]